VTEQKQERYYEYMLRRMREEDEERKKLNIQNKETVLYEAARHVQSVLVEWLNEKKDKMHPEDLKNLETSIKVIDLYGLNYDSKNN
jgi:hypothetical protein